MLATDHRLRDSDAFRRTVRSGRRAGGPALVVHVLERPAGATSGSARVGFVVSKAVGNAVVRNRVRRQLRHCVMENLSSLPARSEVVVRALPPAAGMTSAELGAELARCLERVRRSAAPSAGPAAAARTGAPS